MAASEGMAGSEAMAGKKLFYVFDMDETLSEMHTPFYYISTLLPEESHKNTQPLIYDKLKANARMPLLKDKLYSAFREFTFAIAEKEASPEPLGILRPGILDIMRSIQTLKESGKDICVIIYSNNGHLPSLYFTKNLIHVALGVTDLINDCVHWYNPLRESELILDKKGMPKVGLANKTWAVLQNLLVEGACHASPPPNPDQVMFFDDTIHADLKKVLGENYVQVQPYKYKTPCSKLELIYRDSLESVGLIQTKNYEIECDERCEKKFLEYLNLIGFNADSVDNLLSLLKQFTDETDLDDSTPTVPTDTAEIIAKIHELASKHSGGRRRIRKIRKISKTHKRNRKHRKTRKYKSRK